MIIITKQLPILFFSIGLLCFATVVFAQEESDPVETESSVETTTSGEAVQIRASSSAESRVNLSDRPTENQQKPEDDQMNRVDAQATFASSSAERRAEVQTKVSERKIALQARAQERVTNLAANMSNRMEAVIARMQNVSNRLQSRIDKLKVRGIDTLEAENALASAQISLNAALDEIATIDADVAAAISSSDARAGWSKVKAKFLSIRDHITTAHAELRASVAALKVTVADSLTTSNGVNQAVQAEQSTEAEFDPNRNVDIPATEIISN